MGPIFGLEDVVNDNTKFPDKHVLSRRDIFALEFAKIFLGDSTAMPLTSAVEAADLFIEKLDKPKKE